MWAYHEATEAVNLPVGVQPVSYTHLDSVKKFDAIVGSGGMVVMDTNTCMVEVARFFMSFTQRESCGKCVPCREGTKRMLELSLIHIWIMNFC